MTAAAQTFADFVKDGRFAKRIQRQTSDVVKKMKADGHSTDQCEAIRQATMFAILMVECQRRANRHIDTTFPHNMRNTMLGIIHDAANAVD